MCLLNYNKEKKKYKHLTYAERTMIERQYNKEGLSKKEIAKRLDKSKRRLCQWMTIMLYHILHRIANIALFCT